MRQHGFAAALAFALVLEGAPVAAGGNAVSQVPVDAAAQLNEAHRLFYNGHYERAAAMTLTLCPDDATSVNLDACELRSSSLLFQIKRALPKGLKKDEAYKACLSCTPVMTAFRTVTRTGQLAARTSLEQRPDDVATRYLLGKIDLNHVWLHLGLLGRKTGWGEYWEARRAMDTVLKADPDNVRAQVSRAWIDYIVDTQAPRGTRWILGGGNKTRGLRVVEEAAAMSEAPFVKAEAGFALWDMRVREGNLAGAVVTARELARAFPENEELARFLNEHGAVALD
jgi:hypothetical protein